MVLDLFNSERDVRRSSIEEELQVYSKEETNLELRHDIFEVLKVRILGLVAVVYFIQRVCVLLFIQSVIQ